MSGASAPLARVTSIKLKLGALVAASVVVASVLATVSDSDGIPPWLAIPVTVALALGVTQLLATGMTSPLREMTSATRRMARGDYAVRVADTSSDEVGQLARAFNTMAADLAEVDRQRRELVATVSHELRTPLAGLVGVLENLDDGVVPAGPDAIRGALRQAERLSTLVTDLLDLSRVDAGVVPLDLTDIALADFLTETVREAEGLARPVTYDVQVAPVDLTVRADRARLHQLVANLLDNASRHSPAGGVVRVRASRTEDRWRLEVTDSGAGIAPGDRERVFERFGRADPDGGGTGLGLAIARWVTSLHGGEIAVVDPEGGESGTRLRADLPLAVPSTPPAQPQEAAMTVTPVPAPAPSPAAAPPSGPTFTLGLWPQGRTPGRVGFLLGALGVGLLAALTLPDRAPGLGSALVLLAGGACVYAATRGRRDWFTSACAALAAALVVSMVLRDAAWITTLCALAATVLCVAGCTRARSMPGLFLSGILWPFSAIHGLPWLGRTLKIVGRDGQWMTVVRTVLLSLVGVIVFGLLFGSADALFASWVDAILPDLYLDTVIVRVFVGLFVGGLVLATSYFALNPPDVEPAAAPRRPVRRRYEWLAPVLLVDAVFVLFLVAQAAATFGGHDYVRRTTGLTYADYVHQGFGQLTFATLLTFLVVWAAGRKASHETSVDRAWVRGALGLLCVLTLVVVASALHRMDLYQQAYGFTRLRLLVDVFEGWLGVVVLAVMGAGLGLRARWLPRVALLTGCAALLGLAVANPDAYIARHNLDRYAATGKVDTGYLAGLSADAVPTLAQAPSSIRGCVIPHWSNGHDDWLEWNLGRSRAGDAVKGLAQVGTLGSCP